MNLNNNPSKEELQKLLQAYDDGAGIHVLWVERLGDVQITLLLTETDVDWLNEADGKAKFHYKSFAKNDGRVGKAAAVDELYVTTLFERLVRDWKENKSGLVDP